jgi:predicted ATPase/DNA-binding winged helix-turn-helix (wHTH) protein
VEALSREEIIVSDRAYRFGRFELRSVDRSLIVDGKATVIGARAFDVLWALAEQGERVVSKDELLNAAWPDVVVEENNLQVQVSMLRKVLGTKAIATIPGRGYKLTLAVADFATPTAPADVEPARKPQAFGAQGIPAEVDAIVGRDADCRALAELLSQHRVVTVIGAGGIGKTRLAISLARKSVDRHEDGVRWVDLADLSSRASVPDAIVEGAMPQLGEGRGPDVLARALIDRNMLLVLDNCEHVVDAIAEVVRTVLSVAPGVRVLVTSQVPLHVEGEHLYRLDPLTVPAAPRPPAEAMHFGAVALFVAQARAADSHFELTNRNVDAISDLCRRLDGNALAIKLLASRVRHFGLDGLRERLEALLTLPGTRDDDMPRRQHTPHAALDWSHSLLSRKEQHLFRILGVFAGAFALDLACRVAARFLDEGDVLDGLAELVDRSLVSIASNEPQRYRLLEIPRAYALEALTAGGERQAAQCAHAQSYASLFESLANRMFDGTLLPDEFVTAQKEASDNLRAAIEWCVADAAHVETALALLAHVAPFSFRLGLRAEASRWLQTVSLHLARNGESQGNVALLRFAQILWNFNWTGFRAPAVRGAPLDEDLAVLSGLNDDRRKSHALCALASAATFRGDIAGARAALAEAARLETPVWAPWLRAQRLNSEAIFEFLGIGKDAEDTLARALVELTRQGLGSTRQAVLIRHNMAVNSWLQGRLEEACQRFEEASELQHGARGDSYDMSLLLGLLAVCQAELGRLEPACASAVQCLPHSQRTGVLFFLTPSLAYVAGAVGRADAAFRLLAAGDAYLARTGWNHNVIGMTIATRARSLVELASTPHDIKIWTAEGSALDEAGVVQAAIDALGATASERERRTDGTRYQ